MGCCTNMLRKSNSFGWATGNKRECAVPPNIDIETVLGWNHKVLEKDYRATSVQVLAASILDASFSSAYRLLTHTHTHTHSFVLSVLSALRFSLGQYMSQRSSWHRDLFYMYHLNQHTYHAAPTTCTHTAADHLTDAIVHLSLSFNVILSVCC